MSSLAAVALVLVVAGVWAIVELSGSGGDYASVPDCGVARTDALDALVPDHTNPIDESMSDLGAQWSHGRECRWETPEDAMHVPAAARLVMVGNAGGLGTDGERAAADTLRRAAGAHPGKRQSDLGDQAFTWYDTETDFGCAGVRMSNLYVETCYTAATDYTATEPIPKEDATAGAEELARAIVEELEERPS